MLSERLQNGKDPIYRGLDPHGSSKAKLFPAPSSTYGLWDLPYDILLRRSRNTKSPANFVPKSGKICHQNPTKKENFRLCPSFSQLCPPAYHMPLGRFQKGTNHIYIYSYSFICIYRVFDPLKQSFFQLLLPPTYDMLLGRLRNRESPPNFVPER
jgi:hypothetical protein